MGRRVPGRDRGPVERARVRDARELAGGVEYVRRRPVAESVTVSVYSTLESAPKKTQNFPLMPRRVDDLDDQLDVVRGEEPELARVGGQRNGLAVAGLVPGESVQATLTSKRPSERHSDVAVGSRAQQRAAA